MVNPNDPRLRGISQPQQTPTDPRLRTAEQRIAQARQEQLRKQQLQAEAKKLDEQFTNIKTGNVEEIKKVYSNIPPAIKNRMQYDIKTLEKQQDNRIKQIKDRIKRRKKDIEESRKDEREYKDENRDDRADREDAKQSGYRAEIRELKKFLPKLEKGQILDTREITRIASDVGRAEERKEEADNARKRQQKKVAEQLKAGAGNITSINYKTGQVKVDGKTIKLSPTQAKSLELTSVSKSKAQKDLKNITKKLNKGKSLDLKDFEKARSLGISNKDLLQYAVDVNQYNKQLEKYKQDSQKFRKQFTENLGPLNKVLTPAQKEVLYKSQFVSTTPYLQLPNTIKQELKDIDLRDDLNKLQKEKAKREVLGESIDNLGGQLDLFGKSISQRELEKKISKEVQKNVKNKLKKFQLSPEQKLITGQSMTPEELKQVNINAVLKNKNLQSKQLNNLKTIISSPTRYGQNLAYRYFEKGEKTPLFNDFKALSTGVGKGLYDVFIQPIESSFNYGRNLVKRAEKENKRGIDVLVGDIKLITNTTKDVASFVKENPVMSAIIVNSAIEKGFQGTKKQFIKNPAETTGYALAYLFPTQIAKLGIQSLTQTVKVGNKALKVTPQVARDLTKGIKKVSDSAKVSVGVQLNNLKKSFNDLVKYRKQLQKPEIIKGKQFDEINKVFDKFEKERNIKIPTKELTNKEAAKLLGYEIKEAPKSTPSRIKTDFNRSKIEKILNDNIGNKNILKEYTKQARELGFTVSKVKRDVPLIDLSNNRIIREKYIVGKKVKKVKTKPSRKVKKQQKKDQEKKLTEKKLAAQLQKDKVKRLEVGTTAKADAKRRKQAEFEAIEWRNRIEKAEFKEALDERLTRKKDIFNRKTGQVNVPFISKVVKEDLTQTRNTYKLKKKTRNNKVKGLRRGHKKQQDKIKNPIKKRETKKKNLQELKKELEKQRKELLDNKKKVETKIKAYKQLSKISPDFKKLLLPVIESLEKLLKTMNQEQAQLNKQETKVVQTLKNVNAQLKFLGKKPKLTQKQKTGQTLKFDTKQISTTKPPKPINGKPPKPPSPKPSKPPSGKVPKPPRPKKLPDIDIDWSKRTKPEEVLIFEGVYRERKNKSKLADPKKNPVVQKKIRIETTKNRALKRVADLALNSLVRSVDVKIIGKTGKKIKEINKPDSLDKFRTKRSKNNKVLRLVQKEETLLKTPGEKAEFEKLRRLREKQKKNKPKSSKKTTKKTKSAKKSKKSSKKN